MAAESSLALLAIGQLVAASVGPAGFLLSMTGNERLETINTVVVALLNVFFNFVLITRYGIVGAAIATAISLSLLNVLRVVEVWRLHGLNPVSRSYVRPLVGVAVSVSAMVVVRFVAPLNLFVAIAGGAVGLLVFGVAMAVLGFDDEDRMLVSSVSDF